MKIRIFSWVSALLLLCLAVPTLHAQTIPASERAVLVAIYQQTGGQSWTNSQNWLGAAGTECTWYGVVCSTSNVQQLSLNNNGLTGTLPDLSALTQLQVLSIGTNQLTGNLPSLSGLTQLTSFFANYNKFTGPIPSLNGLSNLQYLIVSGNQLTGSIPPLTGLTHLQYVEANDDQLTGSLPALTGLSNLRTFRAAFNQLSGPIPSLTGLSSLVEIDVSANQLSGGIPSLAGLTNLQYFLAPSNKLSGAIPSLSGLSSLFEIEVSTNRLTGPLPSLAGLPAISLFDVSYNQLSGSIPSFGGVSTTLTYYFVGNNQLTGVIPSLTGLSSLKYFGAVSNQLTGPIPSLSGLTNLYSLGLDSNQLTGAIPPLTGLTSLTLFAVSNNRLSGTLPSLAGLDQLRNFYVGNNGFTGDPPTAPAGLTAHGSSLCNSALNKVTDAAWDAAAGYGGSPWYNGCTAAASTLTISSADTPAATGTHTTLTAQTGPSGSTGTVTITDDKSNTICYILLDGTGHGSCDVILPSGTTKLIAGYSGSSSLASASAQLNKTIPVTVSGNLNQFGWTGAWYNPATSGQGILFQVYPDVGGTGNGLIGGGWFTYDVNSGGEDRKRWYTLTGPVSSSSSTATLDIISPTGGNFNAAPVINSGNSSNYVGHATLNFTDCTHGYLSYSFTDGSGRVGNIPLSRLDSNVTCDPTKGAGNGTAAGTFLLSGGWYTPSTSGQGLLFDINPLTNVTFAGWYTYAPNGQTTNGGASQRWYTLQIGSANVGVTPLNNIGIYSTQGGVFDAPSTVTTPQVGTASIAFNSCSSMVLNYNFTAGTNAGLSGSINLVRVGPAPTGCSL
jgi:Leucine-rich repeat (LRR) protein